MSRFADIDLSAYPPPSIIETLDVEAYLAANKTRFASAWDAIRGTRPAIDTLALEHEPVTAQLRVAAELERMLRGHVNDRIRAVTLASAMGDMLDHIAMTYFGGLTRRVITPAANGAPAVMEDDETFRARIALSPESWSTAGPEGAYLFHALSASGDVLDVAVASEDEGVCLAPRVRVAVLSRLGDGTASPTLISAVQTRLNRREYRPFGDLPIVESAVPVAFNVTGILRIRPGASGDLVKAAAEARIRNYCLGMTRWIGDGLTGPQHLVGRTLKRDTIIGRAYGGDPNIVEFELTSPEADVNAPHAGYTAEALEDVGLPSFTALSDTITAHLRKAPRLGTVTLTVEIATGGSFA